MASPGHQGKLELRTICGALVRIEHKWFKIGIQLGISRSKLQEFKKDDDPFSAVIDYWLKGNMEPSNHLSWQSIVAMLRSEYIGEPGLADEISKKYCMPRGATPESDSTEIAEKDNIQDKNANDDSSSTVPGKPSPSTQQENRDQELKKEVKRILNSNLRDILDKYATYVDCLRVAVDKKVSAKDLRSYLLSLPATCRSNEGEALTLLSDKEAQLKKLDEVIDIFDFIKTKCASFLDYNIFQSIQNRYGICDDEKVFKYPDYLKAYIEKHKISEFEKTNPLLKPKNGSKELILKYDIETTCRLARLTDLKILIADIMEISSLALEIVDVEEGCVIVTFYISASLADALFTPDTKLSPQQEEKLQAASVLWMKCNGRTFHFDKKKLKEEALQKLLSCSICLGMYNDPKQLQCQHSYCQQCLMGLVQQDQQGQPTLTCPTCRQVTPVPASGVAGLQADFRANQLLEITNKEWKELFLSKPEVASPASEKITQRDMTPAYCPNHDKILIEIFCGTCGEAICWKCSRDKHHGHDCESLNEAFIQCKESVLALLQIISTALTKFEATCVRISDQQAAIEEEIQSTITIDGRKTELISDLHQLTLAKLKSLAVQRDQIETIQAQLNKHRHFMENTSNQVEALHIAVKQVKEFNSMLLTDLLEPKIRTDIMFSKGSTIDGKIGVVYTKSSPDCLNFIITGVGNAAVQKKYITTIQVLNWDKVPCEVSPSSISCEVTSEIANTTSGCTLESKGEGQYEISYTPTIKGRHQLHIKMEDQYINGSPFLFRVRPHQVQDRGIPILQTTDGVTNPRGVAVNKKGEIVVVGQHCVTVFSPHGERLQSFGTHGSGQGQFASPCGLTLDGEENILVADWGNHRVQKFTPQGEFLSAAGTKLYYPLGISYNARNDMIYVVDSNCGMQVFDSSLNFVDSFGKEGSGEGNLLYPCHMACDRAGNVYVANWGNHPIQVFTAEGKFLRAFGGYCVGREEMKKPYGIAIDYSDRVYVSNLVTNCVFIYSPEGQFVTSFGREQLNSPSGLAVDDCEVVYVCDFDGNCVELF